MNNILAKSPMERIPTKILQQWSDEQSTNVPDFNPSATPNLKLRFSNETKLPTQISIVTMNALKGFHLARKICVEQLATLYIKSQVKGSITKNLD